VTSPFTCRADAIIWAKTLIADPSVVFLDTETTSLNADAEVVDIGIVALDGTVLVDSLCCPARSIPHEASLIHGITDEHVRAAPSWTDLYPRIASVLTDQVICVYNASYDYSVINGVCIAHHLPEFIGPWQCALKAYAAFVGERSRWGKGFKWHKLDDAADHFGIPRGGHRALSDAETCRRVVLAMAGCYNEPN
jgi:DNA polymerase III subunit epsilon